MKFSISNIAWPKEWDNEVYEELLQLGYHAIEIAPNRTIQNGYDAPNQDIKDWNDSYQKYFSDVSSMQSLLFKIDRPIFESDENMEYILDILKKGLLFASKLKVRNIVFGSPSIRNVNNANQQERSKLFFNKLANCALDLNISVALEPNPKIYNTNFLNTTFDALEYIKQINHPNLGINLDFGTVIENKESIHDIMTKVDISLIKHVHISEPYLVTINSNRRKNHIELLKSLNQLDYKGYISIEMKSVSMIEELIEVLNYVKAIGIEAGVFYEK